MEKIRGRRRLKITRRLELHFWPTRKRSQPSQGDFFPLQREPWSKAHHHSMRVRLMVLNATFYNISVKSWQSFVLVEETIDLSQVTDIIKCCIEYTSCEQGLNSLIAQVVINSTTIRSRSRRPQFNEVQVV